MKRDSLNTIELMTLYELICVYKIFFSDEQWNTHLQYNFIFLNYLL